MDLLPEMTLTMLRLGPSLCPPNGVVEVRMFLVVVIIPSMGPEDDFRLLTLLLPGRGKFAPLVTLDLLDPVPLASGG